MGTSNGPVEIRAPANVLTISRVMPTSILSHLPGRVVVTGGAGKRV